MKLTQKNRPITCLEDWRQWAGPKRPDQWVPDRSAYELANAWCQDGIAAPPAMLDLLSTTSYNRNKFLSCPFGI